MAHDGYIIWGILIMGHNVQHIKNDTFCFQKQKRKEIAFSFVLLCLFICNARKILLERHEATTRIKMELFSVTPVQEISLDRVKRPLITSSVVRLRRIVSTEVRMSLTDKLQG